MAVANFAQSYVKHSFVGALQGFARRNAGQLSHVSNEMDPTHLPDERIVLRHVAYQSANFTAVLTDIPVKHKRRSVKRLVETKQRIDEGGLAGAVRAKQSHGTSVQRAVQII